MADRVLRLSLAAHGQIIVGEILREKVKLCLANVSLIISIRFVNGFL